MGASLFMKVISKMKKFRILAVIIIILLFQCSKSRGDEECNIISINLSKNKGKCLIVYIDNNSKKQKRSVEVLIDSISAFNGVVRFNNTPTPDQTLLVKIDSGGHYVQGVWDKKIKSEIHKLQISKDTMYCRIDIFYDEEVVIKSQARPYYFD